MERDNFGQVNCAVYQDEQGECYFTREQIGMALEYNNPGISIGNIHNRHKERLDKFSIRVPLEKEGLISLSEPEDFFTDGSSKLINPYTENKSSGSQTDNPLEHETKRGYGPQETVLYSRKGIMEICRWSRQPKANAFMDFVWEVTDRLMKGELALVPHDSEQMVAAAEMNRQLGEMSQMMQSGFSAISERMDRMGQVYIGLEDRVSQIDTKADRIKRSSDFANYYLRVQSRSGYDQNWKNRQRSRLAALSEFIGTESSDLLHKIYREMERRYGICLSDFAADYKRVKKVSQCSTLSVISFSLTLREMFDAIVNEMLEICRIPVEEADGSDESDLMDMIAKVAAEREEENEE